jgi:tetratricopeptide (TPR) repeat protein
VPAEQVPADDEQAAALYRQRLDSTRTLIVLDNAATEAQIRPLLPGAGSCLVLITSRRRLKGLDDARILSLDLLSAAESVQLLRAVAGPERVAAHDRLPTRIAELCGYLPLALRIAAALLRHRPAWTLDNLAGLLTDRHQRVQALSDGERDLSVVFDLSYQSLPEPHRALFRRLGLIPGPDLDPFAAAALLGVDPQAVTRLLEDLVDHNLLLSHAPGRYRLHDLIRGHARTLAAADPAPGRQDALDRLLHYYAHTAHSASIPVVRSVRPAPVGPAPAHAPVLPDPETARAWLRIERDNIEHAAVYSRTHDLHEHTIALTAGLAEILRTDGPYVHALALHQAATEIAQHHGHADALTDLGIMRRLNGDLAGAQEALTRALEIHRATGHHHGEAFALTNLGAVRRLSGDLAVACASLTQALEFYCAIGYRLGEAEALTNLGTVRRLLGDPAGAQVAIARALEIYRTTGHRHDEAWALNHHAACVAALGDLPRAFALYEQALTLTGELAKPDDQAVALEGLGACHLVNGDVDAAGSQLRRALEIYQRLGMTASACRVQRSLTGLTLPSSPGAVTIRR